MRYTEKMLTVTGNKGFYLALFLVLRNKFWLLRIPEEKVYF